MSQWSFISGRIRAAIAVVVIMTLTFGLTASGASAAAGAGFGVKNNASHVGGLFACFKMRMTQRADAANEKAPVDHASREHRCPCCLASHAVAAFLPERLASTAVASPAPGGVISYLPSASREPEGFRVRSVHGARAPPA